MLFKLRDLLNRAVDRGGMIIRFFGLECSESTEGVGLSLESLFAFWYIYDNDDSRTVGSFMDIAYFF